MIDAVVFDMDGVLIDSEICWQRAREAFARDRGREWTADLHHQAMGTSTPVWVGLMQEALAPDLSAEAILDEMLGRMADEYDHRLPLRDGAVDAARTLAGHYTVALASGAPTDLIDRVLRRSGLDAIMATVVHGDSVARGKPAPDIYQEALHRLGVAPSAAVGVEDSTNGLRALNAAGLWAIAAPAPDFPLPADVLALADHRIDSLHELDPGLIAGFAGTPQAGRPPDASPR